MGRYAALRIRLNVIVVVAFLYHGYLRVIKSISVFG
jgi:hypothetical protein